MHCPVAVQVYAYPSLSFILCFIIYYTSVRSNISNIKVETITLAPRMKKDELERAFVEILRKQQLNRMKEAANNVKVCNSATTASKDREETSTEKKETPNSSDSTNNRNRASIPTNRPAKNDLGDIDPFPTANVTFNSDDFDVEDLTITRDLTMPLDEDYDKKEKKSFLTSLFSRKALFVLVVMLLSFMVLLIIAVIFRSKRPEVTERNVFHSQLFPSPTMAPSLAPEPENELVGLSEPLFSEGEVCDENDQCESGLCSGMVPPYHCEAKRGICRECNENINCQSNHCVRRSGKSVCASAIDGKVLMDTGCFCDRDEHCFSQKCEGEFPIYTCKAPTSSCDIDSDCPSGICNFGQCSEQ